MDEKEKNCTCGNPDCGAEDIPMPDGDVLIISVAEYKHLIRCEASVDLLYKVLKTYGEYSPECGK